NLMSRKIGEVGRVICARPGYLKEIGVPKRREDLVQHRCIVFTAPGRSRWAFRTADGRIKHLEVPNLLTREHQRWFLQLALHGAGIARLSDYMVARPVRDGRLVALLKEQHHPERTPAYALFPPGTQKVPKVRVFLEFLMERLGRQPARAASDEVGNP